MKRIDFEKFKNDTSSFALCFIYNHVSSIYYPELEEFDVRMCVFKKNLNDGVMELYE